MIAGISSDGLRGILDGTLEGLTPLTILTGVNGSGKSTVLDALLIVESSNPEDAIAQAVRRRKATLFGSRWLVNGKARYASIAAHGGGERSSCSLRYRSSPPPIPDNDPRRATLSKAYPHHIEVEFQENIAGNTAIPDTGGWGWVAFDGDNEFITSGKLDFDYRYEPKLIDPGIPIPLDKSYSEATRLGHREDLVAMRQDAGARAHRRGDPLRGRRAPCPSTWSEARTVRAP